MKIRHSFVSNSSSTSFVIVAPTTIFDQKLSAMHPFVQYVINHSKPTKRQFQGIDVTHVNAFVNTEDDWISEQFTGEIPTGSWADQMCSAEAWDEFAKQFTDSEAIVVQEGY